MTRNLSNLIASTHRRRLIRAAHPDHRGGDRALWDPVQQAARVLGVAG